MDARDPEFGQTALSISMSVLTKEIGARRLQIPRRYREDTAKLLLKLGATPLQKSGVNIVLQRSGDENLGNPNAHNLSAITHGPAWLRVLGTHNLYSASTVDQMPKQVSAGYMFGTMLSVPIPDVDRCDHLLLLGANPLVSNGSLLTAPTACTPGNA